MYSSSRLIIVDDERVVCDVLTHSIRAHLGCTVDTASNAEEAFARIREQTYHIIILDMKMPGLHGIELIQTIRRAWPHLDIIVMTGYPAEFPYVDVIRAGAKDFIAKPHRMEEMEAKIVRLLKEQELCASCRMGEGRYHKIFEFSMNGLLLIREDTCAMLEVNRAFCDLCGRDAEELIGKPFSDLLDPFESGRFTQSLSVLAVNGQGTVGDLVVIRPDGSRLYVDISVTFVNKVIDKAVLLGFRDVTEQRKIEEQLATAAETDEVTRLANRRSFNARLEWAIGRARREHFPLTLVFIDIDNFKRCNDVHGHDAGDRLLRSLAEVIRASVRAGGDEGFRYGGDEFAVLLPGAPLSIGQRVAERMRVQFANVGGGDATLSIGLVQYRDDMSATEFVCAADRALYSAKAEGKNRVYVAQSCAS